MTFCVNVFNECINELFYLFELIAIGFNDLEFVFKNIDVFLNSILCFFLSICTLVTGVIQFLFKQTLVHWSVYLFYVELLLLKLWHCEIIVIFLFWWIFYSFYCLFHIVDLKGGAMEVQIKPMWIFFSLNSYGFNGLNSLFSYDCFNYFELSLKSFVFCSLMTSVNNYRTQWLKQFFKKITWFSVEIVSFLRVFEFVKEKIRCFGNLPILFCFFQLVA